MQGRFDDMAPNPAEMEEGIASQPFDPLRLDIEDDKLVEICDDYLDDYDHFYEDTYNLSERRKRNEIYLFGRQMTEREKTKNYKDYESQFGDNVLYEIEGTIKPLAQSRMPDIMVTPGWNNDVSTIVADQLSKAVDTEIKEYENRFTLGILSKHYPCYFISCMKAVWNPEIDDYEFIVVHPDMIKFDHNATIKNVDKMKWFAHLLTDTIEDICNKFPEKKTEFLRELEHDGLYKHLFKDHQPSWALMATEIKYWEFWFDQYIKHADDEVEKVSGLLWKYNNVILGKMKNPNFDYEGETRYFAYDEADNEKTKRGLNKTELDYIMLTGTLPGHVKEERVYHNYFRFPRKPFYLMGYDQWCRQPLDETSRIEQNIRNQKSLDKLGKKIEEVLQSRGHHILSKDAVTPADAEEIDYDDPDLDLSVEGNPNEVHAYIEPQKVEPAAFEEKTNIKERMYSVSHSQSIRGEAEPNTPATNSQIGREGNFTTADDMVEETINNAAQWMGDWAMQFIKLRYTKDHFKWILGTGGFEVWQKINRNMTAEGMVVKMKASGTDKIRAQNNAMEMAKMQMIDPHSFYTMMGLPDPDGLTEKLILAKADPIAYLQKVCKKIDTSEALAQALMKAQMPLPQQNQIGLPQTPGGNAPGAPTLPQGSVQGPSTPQGGMPQQPVPGNTAAAPVSPPVGPPPGSPRAL